MARMRVRWWLRGTARSAAAAVAAAVVIAGPGAPHVLGSVDGQPVALVAASSVHPAQGGGPDNAGGGGGDSGGGGDGGDSGGTNVSGNPSGGADKSSGGGEGKAPEPSGSKDKAEGTSAGEASGSATPKVDKESSTGEAVGAQRAEPSSDVASTQSGQAANGGEAGRETAAGARRPGEAGDAAEQGTSTSGAPGERGVVTDAMGRPLGRSPAEGATALDPDKLVYGDGTQPGTQTSTASATPGTPGTPPTDSLAVSGSAPAKVDPGANATLKEYQGTLTPQERSQPLDFSSSVVTPEQANALVTQEKGNLPEFNEAVQEVGGPGSKVTQSPILLRDGNGQFGTTTLFGVTDKDGRTQLVDSQGAIYQDVNDYLESNKFDDTWTMVRPAQPGSAEGTQELVSGPAHNTTGWQKVGKFGDEIARPAMTVGMSAATVAAGATALSGGTAAPITGPMLLAGSGLMAASGIWQGLRGGDTLIDRFQHGRSISLSDPEARAAYLNVASGATAGLGGVGGLARGLGLTRAAAAADGAALTGAAGLTGEQGVQLSRDWSSLTPGQRFQRSAEVAGNAGLLAGAPLANRAAAGWPTPEFEGPFLPKNAPSGAQAMAELGPIGTEPKVSIDERKFDYFFGHVTSNKHNADRSTQLAQQFRRVGVYDSPSSRDFLRAHLEETGKAQNNVARTYTDKNGEFEVRDSLFAGPRGLLHLESTWQRTDNGLRLTTVIPYGK